MNEIKHNFIQNEGSHYELYLWERRHTNQI